MQFSQVNKTQKRPLKRVRIEKYPSLFLHLTGDIIWHIIKEQTFARGVKWVNLK